jgi:hypothetical protein
MCDVCIWIVNKIELNTRICVNSGLKMGVIWDVTLCSLVDTKQCPLLVSMYQTTQCYILRKTPVLD